MKLKNFEEFVNESLDWESEEQKEDVASEFEALRRNGSYNMMEFYNVQKEASDNGLYNFVTFFANDRRKYSSFLQQFRDLQDYINDDKVEAALNKLN